MWARSLILVLLVSSCSRPIERPITSVALPVCDRSSYGNAEGDTAYYYSEAIDTSDYYFFEVFFSYGEDVDEACSAREVQIVTSKKSGALKSILVKSQKGHVYVLMDSCQMQKLETTY